MMHDARHGGVKEFAWVSAEGLGVSPREICCFVLLCFSLGRLRDISPVVMWEHRGADTPWVVDGGGGVLVCFGSGQKHQREKRGKRGL
jgi:hypothetical protein